MSHGLATGAFAPHIVPIDPNEGLAAFGPEPEPEPQTLVPVTATPAAPAASTAVAASAETAAAFPEMPGFPIWPSAERTDGVRRGRSSGHAADLVVLPQPCGTGQVDAAAVTAASVAPAAVALPAWSYPWRADEAPGHEPAGEAAGLRAWRLPFPGRCTTACASASAGLFMGLTMAWVLLPQVPVAMEPQVLHIVPPAAAAVRADIVGVAPVDPAVVDVVRVSAPAVSRPVAPAPAVAERPRPVAPPVPAPPAPGWLSVNSPFPVRVFVDGAEVGVSGAGRLTVAPGAVSVRLLNEALEFDEVHGVTVASRRGSSLSVNAPNGVLHVNARPWASVWVDGRLAGETPVGNIVVPVGNHDVVLRHPQLGEQRVAVSVGARTPARVSVEFQP